MALNLTEDSLPLLLLWAHTDPTDPTGFARLALNLTEAPHSFFGGLLWGLLGSVMGLKKSHRFNPLNPIFTYFYFLGVNGFKWIKSVFFSPSSTHP